MLLSAAAVAALRDGHACPRATRSPSPGSPAIQGAKRTPDLIPLCHPIALHGVTVDLAVADDGVAITATVRTADRTGVEMEALTAVAVAALALIDMVKAVDPAAVITDVRVEEKTGGKTGSGAGHERRRRAGPLIRALAITVSNRAAAGVYEDRSGPVLAELLARGRVRGRRPAGGRRTATPVEAALRDAVAAGYDVVVTTGGTGLTPATARPR